MDEVDEMARDAARRRWWRTAAVLACATATAAIALMWRMI